MTTDTTTWGDIIKAGEYEYYGIRVSDSPPELGSVVPVSRIWVDGDPTDECLDGTCAVQVTDPERLPDLPQRGYPGSTLILLGCMYMSYGEDADEIIMQGAVALAASAC